MISSGELSGEQYGADVARALRRAHPDVHLLGMGGGAMRNAEVQLLVDCQSHGSVMGFLEAVPSLMKIRAAYRKLVNALDVDKPALLILIDYPEFNLRLARAAKQRGIKVLYYITPKLWAWRARRVKWFQRYVDRAAVIFPFEAQWFSSHGWNSAEFVGHPLVDSIPERRLESRERDEYLTSLSLDSAKPVLAVFPGSRSQEIARHVQPLSEALALLHHQDPDIQPVVCRAPSVPARSLECFAGVPGTRVVETAPVTLMRSADAGLLKSGTTNLQAALAGLPFSMFYKASATSAWIVRNFVSIREYSIVNLVRPGAVREIVQEQVTAEVLCTEAIRLIRDAAYRERVQQNLAGLREALSLKNSEHTGIKTDVPTRVAKIAISLLGEGTQ
ncbi:MAG: lipid-A-disaccharide synthase [Bdellovibrionota bacterium]|nr:MAG: lipid-A-disaccharide synthase [Bdellovibrionota bacterium]